MGCFRRDLICVAVVVLFFTWPLSLAFNGGADESTCSPRPAVIRKDSRRSLVSTESGRITAVDVRDGCRGQYHLQFITMEPGSLFLPVLLHADMVFYVHSGKGTITYIDEEQSEPDEVDVGRGDVYRLEEGSIFYVHSHPDPSREKLRIYAIFSTADMGSTVRAYSNISDLLLGFNDRVLQMGFGVSEEKIQGIKEVPAPPSIIPYPQKNETEQDSNWKEGIFKALARGRNLLGDPLNKKKKKKKSKTSTFNFFDAKPDVENCNGWSTAVTKKDLKALKGSNMGAFMVNLTRGSMMGPHWNPRATEVAVVTHGQGIVQAVCPGNKSKCRCRYKVEEGDVLVVPRFHPMAQISYNNDSFVFVGFSSFEGKNHPQFLAGQRSVFQVLDREILAAAFNAPNSTIEDLLGAQNESVMLACTSCAEEVEMEIAEEEEARRREEEEARRREEEAKRREEEEEEEARKREEEEEEQRRREEEEEEAARRREEEEKRKKEEEEEQRREKEEEEAARRREEEEKRRKEEEEEEARRREEEEEQQRRREEEEEEEEAARRREEEEQRREKEEEEETRRRKEEEERRREEEEEEEEEGRGREEEEWGGDRTVADHVYAM